MDPQIADLLQLVQAYRRDVREAIGHFGRLYGNPYPYCYHAMGIPQFGTLDKECRIQYFFHGAACNFVLTTGVIDIDLSRAGRYDGVDAHRLWSYVESRQTLYPEWPNTHILQEAFRKAVAYGKIRQLYCHE